MLKKTTLPHFIGWKVTFKRWGWYLLISVLLWFFTAYVNSGLIVFPRGLQFFEFAFIWLFLESLHWVHLVIIHFVLPFTTALNTVLQRIIEVFCIWFVGLICLFLFNFLPSILVFGDLVFTPANKPNLRLAFTVGPLTSIWLYYFVERTRARERLQKEQLRVSQLEKENYQAQLQSLKNQVSPHFLFNSLNTLTSIIPQDSEKAVEYTHRLSDLYRYYLRSAQEDLIPLSEELKILEAYEFLLKTRLGNQVKFLITVDKQQAQTYYLPPMVIQECIENAIKHNRATKENPLQIEVDIKGDAVLIINNKLLKETKTISTQTGWENIKKRYDLLGNTLPEIKESETHYKVILPMLNQD